jgi:hypothetical protein
MTVCIVAKIIKIANFEGQKRLYEYQKALAAACGNIYIDPFGMRPLAQA